MTILRICRRCTQLCVLLGFCALPWLSALGVEGLAGSLFALKLGPIPFADPVAALQVLVTGHWPNARLLLGAAAALAIACILGRIFCSWLCPYGFFSELVSSCSKKKAQAQGEYAFFGKATVLCIALLIFHLYAYPLLTQISFPGELSLVPLMLWQNAGTAALVVALLLPLLVLSAEAFSGKRLWCRYLCPQSVLLGLAAKALPASCLGLRVRWDAKRCRCKQAPCKAACSLGLNPRQKNGPPRRDCTNCGDCIRACKTKGSGALTWSFKSMPKS